MRNKLKEIRLARNMTHEEVAKNVGIDRSTYTNIELGNKTPSLNVAFKIKKVLRCKDDNIFLISECQKGTNE